MARLTLKSATVKARARRMARQMFVDGMSQADIARAEGVSKQAISQRLQAPQIKKEFEYYLQKFGISDETIAEKIKEGLNATKLHGVLSVVVPDFAVRHKYVETVMVHRGQIKQQTTGGGVTVSTIVFNFKSPEKLMSEEEIKRASIKSIPTEVKSGSEIA